MVSGGVLFTSESVTSGHPDKLCDAISDSIVDACLSVDPKARVAVETLVKGLAGKSLIVLAGEVTLSGDAPDYAQLARDAAEEIGYNNHAIGMDATSESMCEVCVNITTQAANIAQGVNKDGAGDQGIMFGFACTETEGFDELKGRYFPLAAALSQRLTRRLRICRELPSNDPSHLAWARPDGKSQVTVEYDAGGNPSRVHTVIIAIQHDSTLKDDFDGDENLELAFVRKSIIEHVIKDAIPPQLLDDETLYVVNGTGRFADPAGPYADAGLTGRKIIVDTYGGMGRHGGGAFSGKDPSKVDRSAAYAARWAAKHVVAAGLSQRCEIQLGYVIGKADPVSIRVETFGTSDVSEEEITLRIKENFNFTPKAIIDKLGLLEPIYSVTASGGHFGRTPGVDGPFPWEVIDAEIIARLQS